MWYFLAILLAAAQAADHNLFKSCAESELCRNFRTKAPDNKIWQLIDINLFEDDVTTLLLGTENENNVQISISAVEEDIFRVRIRRQNADNIYVLENVLDGELALKRFDDADIRVDGAEFTSGNHRAVISYDPLQIEFYNSDVLQVVIDGDRLFIDEITTNFAFQVTFPEAVQLYGLHEHADSLALQTTRPESIDPYRLKNVDVFEYEVFSTMALYGAIPVLYAHGTDVTTGFFLHNAAEQWYEITNNERGSQAYVISNSGLLDLFILPGPRPVNVVRQYLSLTGKPHLPQLWTLGFHHSRYSYESQEDVKDVVANFVRTEFPLDVIWLDIAHSDGNEYFVWNPENFADPIEMQENISAVNKRMVMINDPHIKVDPEYRVYVRGVEEGLFVKDLEGSDFEDECWPGVSTWLDFLNPVAREYYASLFLYENWRGITPVLGGIWNDMNEPSVFNDETERTLTDDTVHFGGVLHKNIHNIYGHLQTISTHRGLLARDEGTKRPFVLTRSHFAGTQRYAAIWTGDNTADWEYLRISYAQCLNANILGIVFCGADVGGFLGNPDVELLGRWYQAGAWLPFYRAHSDQSTNRREPYLYDDSVQSVLKIALWQRYEHLPVWYTLFFEHVRFGDPIIRPLFYQYPSDPEVLKIDDQLLVGTDILVRAIHEPGVRSVRVYFPGGRATEWLRIDSLQVYPGTGYADILVSAQAIPVFYRIGSIIVTKERRRLSSDEMLHDGHTIIVIFDAINRARGRVYIDDYTSFNYRDNLEYNYLAMDFNGPYLTIEPIDQNARTDEFSLLIEQIIVLSPDAKARNGEPGKYEKRIFKTDLFGNAFSDLKTNFSSQRTFKLW